MNSVIFDNKILAEGYAIDRPYFHPIVIDKIQKVIGHRIHEFALDVGCGTGLSAVALKGIADKIIAVDSSAEMIDSSIMDDQITYRISKAEEIELNHTVGLMTLSGSINWIDEHRFFSKASGLLDSDGWIIIYDNNILGEMEGGLGFSEWYNGEYSLKYPKPARKEQPLSRSALQESNLTLFKADEYTNSIRYSKDGFVRYIMTQSNITAAIKEHRYSRKDIELWLSNKLDPIFGKEERNIVYGGYIWYVKKVTS